jgi:predicted DNA-binding transcriptional regulator YafY
VSLRAELVRAIAEHRVVELRYDQDLADRRVQPHVLYRTSAGKECVDTYQVEGPTHSGALPDWRLFALERIRRLDVLDETFAPAPGYNPKGRKYRHGVAARA